MKIRAVSFQSKLPKFENKEHVADGADVAENVSKKQQTDAKLALRDQIQRQIAEIHKAQSDKGENNPRVQRLMDMFKSGKKLTPDEMAYVRQNAPGMMDYIERISREREVVEWGMRIAPSKLDVQSVVLHASKQIAKHQSSEERVVRALQVADAQYEYMQTDEYKDKPDSPLDHREKPASPRAEETLTQPATMAIVAYEQAKLVKSGNTAHVMKNIGSHFMF